MKKRLMELAFMFFVPVVASAQVTVFSDNFSSGSTINASVPTPPTSTSTSYEEIASKAWSPNPPTLTAGDLQFGIAKTSGGGTEVQALFTTTPVVLQNAGDSIQLTVVFTETQGILSSDTQWGIGLFDAGQVAPWGGGLNNSANNGSGNTNAAVGGAQNWQGCIAQIAYLGGSMHSQFAVRKQQDNGDNRNQVTEVNGSSIYAFQNPTYINSSDDPNVALTDGNQYAEVLTYTLLEDGSMEMVASLYANSVGGDLLTTMTATNDSPLSLSFDGLSMGFKSKNNSTSVIVDISSIQVVTTAAYAGGPTCLTEAESPANLLVGQSGGTVTVTVPADATTNGPVAVDLVSSDPAVAYAADATGGTLTLIFPQNSPYTTTNVAVTAAGSGSTVFYLTNSATCIDEDLNNSVVTVSCDPISLNPVGNMVSIVGQTSQTVTVSIPGFANASGPVTVDLVSLNPSVATPEGAVNGTLSLTFPAGGTNVLSVPLDALSLGTATLILTNDAGPFCTVIPDDSTLVVTVSITNGITGQTENFDSQSQAAADGWVDFDDQINGESYGWSDSANAGGDQGEAGGSFVRYTNRNYYADVTVGPLTLNDTISASGLLFIAPPSQNAAFNICYFNTNDPTGSQNILGLGLADGAYPSQRISATAGMTDGTYHENFGPAQLNAATQVTWSFDYDPTAGTSGNGQLTLNYTVNGSPYTTTLDLTAGDRLKGANFNAFGLLVRGVGGLDTDNIMGVYMDSVTYNKGHSLAPSPVPLQVVLSGSSLTFSWSDPSFSLSYSTNVAGPYVKIPGAASGFITNTTDQSGFFRLEWP